MVYKVFVSNGIDGESFYCKRQQQADLLYRVCIESGFFSYVSLEEVIEERFLQKEWSDPDEQQDY